MGSGEWKKGVEEMRLVDADALLQAIEDNSPMNWTDSDSEIQADIDYKCFADMVKNQQTAYDVDAVVKELSKYKNFITIQARNFVETAINIVKEGVKDGKDD